MSWQNLQRWLLAASLFLSLSAICTVLYKTSSWNIRSYSRNLRSSDYDYILDWLGDQQKNSFYNDQEFISKLRSFMNCENYLPKNIPGSIGRDRVPVYIITPTYPRPLQIPELTRMGQTLKHVENLIWIIAEDSDRPTPQVLELLEDLGIYYQYILSPMPVEYKAKDSKTWPKGVENRNKGVEWIIDHVNKTGDDSGVFYFADDDNTYDIRLFEEIRKTTTLSLFPVGLIANLPVSTPVLFNNGTFQKFYDGWVGGRTFPVDMASFAVNIRHFMKVNAESPVRMDYKKGYEEDSFLKRLKVDPKDVQFLAENCTKIYVWHTKSQTPSMKAYSKLDHETVATTNLGKMIKDWCLYVDNQPCDYTPADSEFGLSIKQKR